MHVRPAQRIRRSLGRLVVPPFDCAWLSEAGAKINNDRCCIVFEVSGETDATVILTTKPGSRRLLLCSSDSRYVIIFGSHRNSLLCIERNGCPQATVREDWTQISPHCFRKFWICYAEGSMYFGTGDPSGRYQFKWQDTDPLEGIHFVGLSAWDKHCTFRKVHVLPSIPWLEVNRAVRPLFDICAAYLMDHLHLGMACQVFWVLDQMDVPNLEELWQRCVTLVAQQFEVLVRDYREVFCQLPSHSLTAVLKSPDLSLDEAAIFDAMVQWITYGRPHVRPLCFRPPEQIKEVIKWIRFTTIETEELQAMLTSALSTECSSLRDAILEALETKSVACQNAEELLSDGSVSSGQEFCQSQAEIDIFWRRTFRNGAQLQYCFDGDKKGVINFLAHDCGKKPWKNPMLNKKLLVKASSPSNRSTCPKDVVGEKFCVHNFAGPKRTNKHFVTWWMIDLLDYTLMCNYYTIRHDASDGFIRSWEFQASRDGEKWAVLRRHLNDTTINASGAYGSWPIYCNAQPYRMFRLWLTGVTESQLTPHSIALSSLELYGVLIGPGIHS